MLEFPTQSLACHRNRALAQGAALLMLTLALLGNASANPATPAAADPVLEKRVMAISGELRCLVCQNQTIADSHADLAIDLRNQVREKLAQGWSDKDVVNFMVQRYGDFVLYRPPVKQTTWLLWFGPFALLAGGLAFLGLKLRQQRTPRAEPSAADMQRAAALLHDDGAPISTSFTPAVDSTYPSHSKDKA